MDELKNAMMEAYRKERAVRGELDKLDELEKQNPSAVIEQAFEKGCDSLKEALVMFERLGQRKFNDWLLEDVDFPAAMHDIDYRILVARRMFKSIRKYDKTISNPKVDKVVNNLTTNCVIVDSYVHACNTVLFNIMESCKWMEPEAQRYRTLYLSLTETVSDFYNVVKIPISDWIGYICKTKNIKGEQLFAGAVKPSATDNPGYRWLTDFQWDHGMERDELKAAKI